MIDEMHLNVQIRNYAEGLKRQNNFVGYCLAVVTTSLSLLTANFQSWILPAHFWQGLFLIADGGLIVLAYLSGKAWWKYKEITPEELIEGIKEKSVAFDDTSFRTIRF